MLDHGAYRDERRARLSERAAGDRVRAMRKALRLGVALLFGLLVFTIPLLGFGEREQAAVGRAAIVLGTVSALLVCGLKDRRWMADRAERHVGALIAALVLTVAAIGYYLFVYFRPGFPTETMFALAVAAYAVFGAIVSATLTLLGYAVAERLLPDTR